MGFIHHTAGAAGATGLMAEPARQPGRKTTGPIPLYRFRDFERQHR